MKKLKFRIQDWAGNLMHPDAMIAHYKVKGLTQKSVDFKSFDDAEEFLSIVLGDDYETDRHNRG